MISDQDVLPIEDVDSVITRRSTVDPQALEVAIESMNDLQERGDSALIERIDAFGERSAAGSVWLDRSDFAQAVNRIDLETCDAIEAAAERIRSFALDQRSCLRPLSRSVVGGSLEVGHDLVPMEVAGCYVPGGRFPLPSSLLMTVVPAVVAGVENVRVSGPRPTDATLAAAWFAGVDSMMAAGGAHAIGALALGIGGPACDVIVGPGNRFVTAAKALVAGPTAPGGRPIAIDGLAGPSELLVLADEKADPAVIAADLLAQAEHDPDAGVWLAIIGEDMRDRVRTALREACETLPEPNRSVARESIARGAALVARDSDDLVRIADRLAAEHLEIVTGDAEELAGRVRHAGAIFVGSSAAEVFGDYGVGPNHVLPTGGSARTTGGLSVLDFIRVRTRISSSTSVGNERIIRETACLARAEGLEGHARAAEIRLPSTVPA